MNINKGGPVFPPPHPIHPRCTLISYHPGMVWTGKVRKSVRSRTFGSLSKKNVGCSFMSGNATRWGEDLSARSLVGNAADRFSAIRTKQERGLRVSDIYGACRELIRAIF
ncbi:hypothetical protein CEXT_36211 [Caerostris extrusa]|uniref:Uncharacterized protein n=1 Tax=Caerostris extrusa TaxID=172846 RepID=A0AAV4ME81_CAEEX|nr:hypothetical protein CEXT_36211 [Caerostris extrusa]